MLHITNPFYEIHRRNDDGSHTMVHRSETCFNNINPHWSDLRIPMRELCRNQEHCPLRIDVYDHHEVIGGGSGHHFLGEVHTTVRNLLSCIGQELFLMEREHRGYAQRMHGHLSVFRCQIDRVPVNRPATAADPQVTALGMRLEEVKIEREIAATQVR
jgi:hypothetical protein